MALRFRKSIKLAPGVRWNVSGSGSSWSFGPRGASVNVGKRGTYLNTGIPGTGLYARERLGAAPPRPAANAPATTSTYSLTCGISDDGVLTFKDANGNAVPENLVEVAKKQNREAIQGLIQTQCDQINGQVDILGRLHCDTPDCRTTPKFMAPLFDSPQPSARAPIKPGFFDKLLKSRCAKIDSDNRKNADAFALQLQIWQQEKADFDARVAKRREFVERLIYSDVLSMEKFLEESLQDITWPRETAITFDINDRGATVLLDVDLPELEDMPTKLAAVPSRGLKLSVKEMSAAKVQKLYSDHVHSLMFRLIGEVFAALPSAQRVTCSGYSQRRSQLTGQLADEYLMSVRATRADWQKIDFKGLEAIDVAQALSMFELVRDQLKSGLFKAITPHRAA